MDVGLIPRDAAPYQLVCTSDKTSVDMLDLESMGCTNGFGF
jgi:hypothetical protein